MKFRAARRAVTLGFVLVYCLLRSLVSRLIGPDTLERRAQWLHESGQLAIGVLDIRLKITGNPPKSGLLVANHLSYLDILAFAAAMPCYLVSKVEIGRWPFFGTLARSGGTMFVDRSSRASAEQVTEEIAKRLKDTVPVLFFPEGTSTDGTELLRFHSRLFTPAVEGGIPVATAAVRYVPEDGSPENALCWVGDDAFLPHLWRTLDGPNFSVEVVFGEPRTYKHRRVAADATRAEISAMRETGAPVLRQVH